MLRKGRKGAEDERDQHLLLAGEQAGKNAVSGVSAAANGQGGGGGAVEPVTAAAEYNAAIVTNGIGVAAAAAPPTTRACHRMHSRRNLLVDVALEVEYCMSTETQHSQDNIPLAVDDVVKTKENEVGNAKEPKLASSERHRNCFRSRLNLVRNDILGIASLFFNRTGGDLDKSNSDDGIAHIEQLIGNFNDTKKMAFLHFTTEESISKFTVEASRLAKVFTNELVRTN